ncbi:hypothetical protein TRVL_05580 [Trypanosoma vivax]|nr:hypothetical protein TRVL_05580 [Trypanosoma vivax]
MAAQTHISTRHAVLTRAVGLRPELAPIQSRSSHDIMSEKAARHREGCAVSREKMCCMRGCLFSAQKRLHPVLKLSSAKGLHALQITVQSHHVSHSLVSARRVPTLEWQAVDSPISSSPCRAPCVWTRIFRSSGSGGAIVLPQKLLGTSWAANTCGLEISARMGKAPHRSSARRGEQAQSLHHSNGNRGRTEISR